jgi:hypothetical protein
MKTPKKQETTAIKCLLDIRSAPPSAYVLPEERGQTASEGRDRSREQTKHLSRQRRELAIQLSTYADADGTNIRPSVKTLMFQLEHSRATIYRTLKDLKALGYLLDGEIHVETGAKTRSLVVSKIMETVSSAIDTPPVSSAIETPEIGTPVSSAGTPVSSAGYGVSSAGSPVSSAYQTQPSLDRHYLPPDRPTPPSRKILNEGKNPNSAIPIRPLGRPRVAAAGTEPMTELDSLRAEYAATKGKPTQWTPKGMEMAAEILRLEKLELKGAQ